MGCGVAVGTCTLWQVPWSVQVSWGPWGPSGSHALGDGVLGTRLPLHRVLCLLWDPGDGGAQSEPVADLGEGHGVLEELSPGGHGLEG